MTDFYGKTYLYRGKTIGVCHTINLNEYMVGYPTPGGHKRMKAIPISDSAEVEQAKLDEFAKAKGLSEARS